MGVSLRVVSVLLFGSGFAALVYQTAWQRIFKLTFGASTGASAAVLAIFLGGLGVGGLLFGRRVEKSPRPLLLYGNLEVGIALLAAISPFLAQLVHTAYLSLGGSSELGSVGATLLRLLGTILVIGPAAVLMGGTLPAAARAVVHEQDVQRSHLARLYALNTVGAVFGSLVGPLVLFHTLGTQFTLWCAASLNLLVAIFARSIGRAADPIAVDDSSPSEKESPTSASEADSHPAAGIPAKIPAGIIYGIAAAVGFVFLALELVWYRMLAPILGGSSITFGLILASALAGIGVGGYIYSKRSSSEPPSLRLLAATLAIEAVCVLIPFAWGDDLASIFAHFRHISNLGYGHLIAAWLGITGVVVFPAAVVSGYQFPLLFALLGAGRSQVAIHVGTTYAFNTLGVIAGSLLAGFVLLPTLGAVLIWKLVAAALLLIAVCCLIIHTKLNGLQFQLGVPASAILLGGFLLSFPGPGAVWRHTPIGAGRVQVAEMSPNDIIAFRKDAENAITWSKDGVETNVALSVRNGFAFLVNGKADGSVGTDTGTQTFLGLLPAALNPESKSAFVVGLGTGMTAGLLAEVPGMEHVTVAELEPAILHVARYASAANANVLDNPKVKVAIGDGRELLLTSKQSYDLIISEPSNPYRAGISSLFTQEFYQATNQRLAPGGLFVQWLQGYEIDASALSIAITTLRSVYPHISIWGPSGNDLLLIATHEPQSIDLTKLEKRVSHPFFQNWMRRVWKMEGALGILAHHIASPKATNSLIELLPRSVNTDDLNLLEADFARHVGTSTYSANEDLFRSLAAMDAKPEILGEINQARLSDLKQRVDWSGYIGEPASPKEAAVQKGCSGQIRDAAAAWPEDAKPEDMIETWVYALILADQKSPEALEYAQKLEHAGFLSEAHLVRGVLANLEGRLADAQKALLLALSELRKTAFSLCDTLPRALRNVEILASKDKEQIPALLAAIAQGEFAVQLGELERQRIQFDLALKSKDPKACVEAMGPARYKPHWTYAFLLSRMNCLEKAGEPDAEQAKEDLIEFISKEPTKFSALN